MRLPNAISTLAAALLFSAGAAGAADTSTTSVAVNVHVSSRSSLRVSSELLQFSIGDGSGAATAAVEFSAGARVPAGSDVVLTIEASRAIEGPGGAADVDAAVEFTGVGTGTVAGTLAGVAPAVAGRWHGSGLRQGRMLFTLHAAAPGAYSVPVRFVLSTP